MILEGTIYCEGPNCKTHQHVGPDTMAGNRLPGTGWIKITVYGSGIDLYAFCGTECLMRWCAQFDPPEIISFGDDIKEE